jgi:hypothetical protein
LVAAGKCQHCERFGVATLRRQNTRYVNDPCNWVYLCDPCSQENAEYWADMWTDYWGSVL